MAAPVYATDLATTTADTTKGTIYRQDSTTALTTTGCLGTLTHSEPTGSTAGGIPTEDTDYFILGVATADKSFNATGLGGLGVTSTNSASVPTDGAIFVWGMFTAPNSVNVKSSGGIQVVVGSTVANYKRYYVAGEDSHPYGGWRCYPVSYTLSSNGTTIVNQGTPGASPAYFGMVYNVDNAVSKGNPAALGGIRFGRGYILCTNGDLANGYATFTGASTFNDYNNGTNGWNRLGILQYTAGVYQFQGLFQMGSSTTAVDFRDSNKSIVINNTEFVTANFNTFEVQNASSRVDWTGITITALGTVSKGRFITTDNADINKDTCTFTDMGTFSYLANSTILSTTYRRCGEVTLGSGVMTGCTVEASTSTTGAVTLLTATTQSGLQAELDKLTSTNFVNNTTPAGALRLVYTGTAGPISLSMSSNTFSGNTADIRWEATTGSNLTINKSNTANPTTYSATNSNTVTFTASYPITVTVKDASGNLITGNGTSTGARVSIFKDSNVKISSASWATNVITVNTAAVHGLLVGNTVLITGVQPAGYNGIYTVATVPTTSQFTVANAVNPGTHVANTGTSTLNVLPATFTNASGQVTGSYSGLISIRTKVRYASTTGQKFVSQDIGGSITSAGYDLEVSLIPDSIAI